MLNRTPFDAPATRLFERIEAGQCHAFTSALNLVHTHYQLRKQTDEHRTRTILEEMLKLVEVVSIPGSVVSQALANSACKDFEDAVQYAICRQHGMSHLITRNQRDFPRNDPSNGEVIVCDAETYLRP